MNALHKRFFVHAFTQPLCQHQAASESQQGATAGEVPIALAPLFIAPPPHGDVGGVVVGWGGDVHNQMGATAMCCYRSVCRYRSVLVAQ